MTFIYPVILTKREDGSWEGEFPDLEMCRCEGPTLHEALEDDPVMPGVSDAEDLVLEEGQQVRSIMVHYRFYEGWDE